VALAAVGVLMIREDMAAGWVCLVLFGAGTSVFLVLLIRPNRLEINATGIAVDPAFRRSWSADWSQCGPFRVYDVGEGWGSKKLIVFNCAVPTGQGRRVRRFNRMMGAGDAWLSDTYGMRASELAALLNSYRDASGQPAAMPKSTLARWIRSKRSNQSEQSAP
jgi:hypothetical protein